MFSVYALSTKTEDSYCEVQDFIASGDDFLHERTLLELATLHTRSSDEENLTLALLSPADVLVECSGFPLRCGRLPSQHLEELLLILVILKSTDLQRRPYDRPNFLIEKLWIFVGSVDDHVDGLKNRLHKPTQELQ